MVVLIPMPFDTKIYFNVSSIRVLIIAGSIILFSSLMFPDLFLPGDHSVQTY